MGAESERVEKWREMSSNMRKKWRNEGSKTLDGKAKEERCTLKEGRRSRKMTKGQKFIWKSQNKCNQWNGRVRRFTFFFSGSIDNHLLPHELSQGWSQRNSGINWGEETILSCSQPLNFLHLLNYGSNSSWFSSRQNNWKEKMKNGTDHPFYCLFGAPCNYYSQNVSLRDV